MEHEKELIRILKEKRNYKEEEILKRFKITKKEFFELIIYIIEDRVKRLDLNSNPNRYKHLYKAFKYFDAIEEENSIIYVVRKLKNVRLHCERVLNKSKTVDSDNVLNKMIDIINVTLIRIDFNQSLDKSKEIDENARNYMFLNDLIYKVKNYDYVYEIFKTLPKLMNTTNQNNQLIIEELIEKYMDAVIDGREHYNIVYFEKVIKIFLNSNKFWMDKNYKKYLIDKLLLSLDKIRRSKTYKKEIERISFFFNELIKDIRNSNQNMYLDDLNYKYSIVDTFSESILREAKVATLIDEHEYLDLRDKFLITVDKIGTLLYDDSYYFEQMKDGTFFLGVFTPDVDSHLKLDSLLEQNAFISGESIYMYKNQVHIFPYEFSRKLTLVQNHDRYAIGYFFKFDPQMNLIEFYAKRAIINVNHNLYYNDVDNILKTSSNVEVFKTLKAMINAIETLKSRQMYNVKYGEFKKIKRNIMNVEEEKSVNNEGSILSTFNVLVNHWVAEYFNKHNYIAFPYYVNLAQYDDALIRDLKLKIRSGDSFETILNCLNEIYVPSFYSTQNKGHNGLNLMSYSTASNPLRQYVSILTQRLVKRHMIDGIDEPLIDIMEMNKICDHLNNRRKINDEYKMEYVKYLRYKQH